MEKTDPRNECPEIEQVIKQLTDFTPDERTAIQKVVERDQELRDKRDAQLT